MPETQRIIEIPVPHHIWSTVTPRSKTQTPEHQQAVANLGESIHQMYVGNTSTAAAAGEVIEEYAGTFFSDDLPHNANWCLHAAFVSGAIVVRAGFLIGLTDDEPIEETFADETDWIFRPNRNETWAFAFKEDLSETIEMKSDGEVVCRIRFTMEANDEDRRA